MTASVPTVLKKNLSLDAAARWVYCQQREAAHHAGRCFHR